MIKLTKQQIEYLKSRGIKDIILDENYRSSWHKDFTIPKYIYNVELEQEFLIDPKTIIK